MVGPHPHEINCMYLRARFVHPVLDPMHACGSSFASQWACLHSAVAVAAGFAGRPLVRARGRSRIGHALCVASSTRAAYNGTSATSASTSRPSVLIFGISCVFSGLRRRGHRRHAVSFVQRRSSLGLLGASERMENDLRVTANI